MIVFLHIPKTAGSTFQFVLENNFPLSNCHTNHVSAHAHKNYSQRKIFDRSDFEFARKVFPRLQSIAGHNLVDPLTLSVPDPFYTTFLREPISRVLSQYQERKLTNQRHGRPMQSFEEALRTDGELENLHVKLMAGERNLDKAKRFLEKCSFVGLTEKFDLSLHVLGGIYPGKLNLNYQRRRVQTDNAIKKSIEADSRLMEMARERNKLDVELYSFAVNEIFPRLCANTGFSPSDEVARLDNYTHRVRPKMLLNRFYNQSIYRQVCKFRNKISLAKQP